MNKPFIVLLLSIAFIELSVDASALKDYTVDQMIASDWNNKNNYNSDNREKNNLPPIEISTVLMNAAQKEADRLAKLKKIQKSSLKLDFDYTGYVQRVHGLINNSNIFCYYFLYLESYLIILNIKDSSEQRCVLEIQ